jgi:hypothetical protein
MARRLRKSKAERPHWTILVVAYFTVMWMIYG